MAQYRFPKNTDEHQNWTRISVHERTNEFSVVSEGEESATITRSRAVEEALHQIYLYMPSSIQVNDGLTYENVDLRTLLSIGAGIIEEISSTGEIDTNTASTAVLSKVAQGGGLGSGLATQALIQRGEVLNPRTQMLFKGPVLRQLALTYKMMPSNREEAEEIFNIIKTLRQNAYPTLTNASFFVFPKMFRVSFINLSGGDLKMVKFQDLYLTSINTNYNATQPIFFEDGNPHEVDLTVTFQESEVITSENVEQGY